MPPSQTAPDQAGKSIFIKDLNPKDSVQSSFLVKSKGLRPQKNGQPCLHLHLADSTGWIEARLWDGAEAADQTLDEGSVIAVAGRMNGGAGRSQLTIQQWLPLSREEIRWEDYYPAGPGEAVSEAERYERLIAKFEAMENRWIAQLGVNLLRDPEIASRYPRCPAAKTIHHAFIGGLLTHTLQLIEVIERIAPLYPQLDREILLFGATFHDFGKVFELSFGNGPFAYTDEGRLIGHISIGQAWIDRKVQEIPDFPSSLEIQLKHLVLTHHGRLEYGSPKLPQTLEAVVLAAVDDLDSKIDSITQWIQTDRSPGRWTAMHKAYGVAYYRTHFEENSHE